MKNPVGSTAAVLALVAATMATAHAHNLDTRATGISFAQDFLAQMSQRAAAHQSLMQVGDEFWVVAKTTPGPGTTTGVGGYQTFYIPSGMQVVDVAYVQPGPSDPRGFVSIPMKGQSPIAIGAGSIGAKVAVGLTGYTYPAANVLGINEAPVTATGLCRGTIAGVYADTGIFYSTDPRTVFNSYGAAPSGGASPMINNSGDTVGEWDAANVAGTTTLGVMNLWDSYQLRAFGRKDVAALIDSSDERGNAPWGMACAVAGPQSGYAWAFDYAAYVAHGNNAAAVKSAIEVGPWNRIKYPGSQVSKDQAGLLSTALGYAGIDASNLGYAMAGGPLPATVNAVRFAIGQLELGRSEYSAVKVKVLAPTDGASYKMYADAFGGDAGGTDNGKDHIWRYFDPTVIALDSYVLLQKVAKDPLLPPGGTTSFTLTFANNGAVALPNVVLTDTLPSGLTYLSASPTAGVSGSILTWSLGTVNPGQMVTLTVNVKATATGTQLNTVTATSNGNFVAYAEDTVEVGVRALLREVKTVTPSGVAPGDLVTYTMTVFNEGTGPNGVPLVVTDYLPGGFTYVSLDNATINGAAITPATNSSNPGQPIFTIGTAIQAGKTLVINFKALVGPNTPPGIYYNQVDLTFEGKRIPPIPEAPVTVGGGQIGDTVYTDTNGNGTQNAGEPGIAGITVSLYNDVNTNDIYDAGDALVGNKVTDANGNYLFTGLPPGEYVVKINVPPTGANTGNPAGGLTNPINEGAATLTLNGSILSLDFGYQSTATTGSIGDQVFHDVNGNGVYDAGDSPLANVTVQLCASDGTTLLATTATDAGGLYTFAGRPAGTYVVKVDLGDPDIPTHLVSSVSGGACPAFTLGAGQALTDKDFPFVLAYIDKTVDKATAVTGDTLTFAMRAYYPGPALLTNATVTDVVPAGTTYQNGSANAGGSHASGSVTWSLGSTTAAVNGTKSLSGGPGAITQRGGAATGTATSGTSLSVNMAAGVVAGDVMIASVVMQCGSTPDITGPSGWTEISTAVVEGGKHMQGSLFYKVAGASEAGPYLFSNVGQQTITAAISSIVAFSGVDTTGGFLVGGGSGGPFDVAPGTLPGQGTSNPASAAAITTNSSNAAVIMFGLAGNTEGSTWSAWKIATGSQSLTELCDYRDAAPSIMSIGSAWALKAAAGTTGDGTATLTPDTHHTQMLLALKPGTNTFSGSTALSANRSLETSGNTVTVTLTATATGNAGTVTAGALTATGTNSSSAVCSAASPLTATINNGTATFTYTCTVTAGAIPGVLTFKATPSGSIGGPWSQGVANTVLVSPPLTFAAIVNANPGVSVVTNTAQLKNNTGAALLATSPPTTTTLLGSIGGYVWWDSNCNHTFNQPADSSELPIKDAYVILYADANNNGILDVINGDYQIAAVPTDASGHYSFDKLPAGQYLVDVYEDSFITGGVRNVVPTTPNVRNVNLASGETYPSADFGYFVGARIEGNVFWDANRDTVFDLGETGLTPVRVFLTGFDMFGKSVTATATTDVGGHFVIVEPEGNYTLAYSTLDVLVTNSSLTDTTTATSYKFHASPGEDWHPVFNFGVDNNGKIGGAIFADVNGNGAQNSGEPGLSNVTVELYQDNNNSNLADAGDTLLDIQLTDADGKYLFVGLADGNYVVNVLRTTVPVGYDAVPTARPPTEWVSGSAAGATISGGSQVLDRDFGYHPTLIVRTISGVIFNDINTNGVPNLPAEALAGVTVTAAVDANHDNMPEEVFSATTDDGGIYQFQGVPDGSNIVISVSTGTLPNGAFVNTVDPDGTPNSTTNLLNISANVTNQNFGYVEHFGSIAGTVVKGNGNGRAEPGEPVLGGVSVTLTYAGADGILGTADDQTFPTTTNSSGDYSFANLLPGAYAIVTTVPSGFYVYADRDGFNPNNISLALAVGMHAVDQDFEYQAGSIGDFVWLDLNGNGAQDGEEPPLAGVRVYIDSNSNGLYDSGEPAALTNASGHYLLSGLDVGTYGVRVDTSTLPAGISPTFDLDGYGTPNVATVALVINQDRIDVDFGYRGNATVTGHLYIDTSGNGTQDVGEPNLPNVDVVVTDSLGHSQTVTTDANGNWSVWVIAGSTTANVVETDPDFVAAVFAGYTQTEGDDPTTVIAVASSSVSAGNDGYFMPGSITGVVRADTDNNGSGDAPLADVTVTLKDSSGNDIDSNPAAGMQPTTTTTAVDGSYSFTKLPPGSYQVVETDPSGYVSLTPNQVSVTVSQGGMGVANFVDTQLADLTITKTDNTATYIPGAPTTYTIVVGNKGPGLVTGATVSDMFPVGVTSVKWNAVASAGASVLPDNGTGDISGTVTLPPGGSVTYTAVVQISPSATGNLINTAMVTPPEGLKDTDLANNAATDTDTATPEADLTLTKTDNTATYIPGTPTTYTIVVGNKGPGLVTGAAVSDMFPVGVTSVKWNAVASAGASVLPDNGTGDISGTVTLPPGGSVTYTAVVQISPSATGNLINTAMVTPPDGLKDTDLTNNSATDTDTATPEADLAITKTVDKDKPLVGSQVVFTLTATNHGPSAATGVKVTDTLPSGYQFVSASPSAAYSAGVWTIGSLAKNASVSLQITAKVNATGDYLNVATITGTEQDPDQSNNSAERPTVPIPLGYITGFVLADTNNDDIGEVGIPSVILTLVDSAGNPVDGNPGISGVQPVTVTTASNGSYSFGDLAPGTYGVLETQPSGYDSVSDSDGGNPNEIRPIAVAPGATISGQNFIEEKPGTIAGHLYIDTNGNFTQDNGEPDLVGVDVIITDSKGTTHTVTSDASGNWSLSVTPGITKADIDHMDPQFPMGSYEGTSYPYSQTEGTDPTTVAVVAGMLPPINNAGFHDPHWTDPASVGSIGNLVWFDTNHNGLADPGEPGLPGVTVELYKSTRIPGVDPPVASTVTNAIGIYLFTNAVPGDYVVYLPTAPDFPPGVCIQQSPNDDPIDNDNNGSQPVLGGPVSSPVIHIGWAESNMTIDFGFACYGTWQEWQFLNPLDGKNHPSDDPDGDGYDNLIEYAFRLPAGSGTGIPLNIRPSTSTLGVIEVTFTRPTGATSNVTYYLEYSQGLGNPTSWISIPLNAIGSRNMVVTPVSPCTESVTIRNFEARKGFVRIRAELDLNGDHVTDHVARTETEGWTETALGLGIRTYNDPYLCESVFTGTVDNTGGVSIQTLHFAQSAGSVDLATLLQPRGAYYLEVTSGINEGQRFDVVSASGNTVTLATDGNLFSATPPFNTLTGALPASLAGNRVVIRRHWTLGELFPVGRFFAAGVPTAADQVQTFANGAWTTYWLFTSGGSLRWVKDGDGSLADQAATVLAPGQGMFVTKRSIGTTVVAFGEVRKNKFITPLHAGINLVGGGFPSSQSATGPGSRQMDLAHGFMGGLLSSTADMFSVWKGDTAVGSAGYDDYSLYQESIPVPLSKWVKVGVASLAPQDAELLFLDDCSVFIQTQNALQAYTVPCPWIVSEPSTTPTTTTITTAWSQWQSAELAGESLNGPLDDPDHDGTPNLLEYAFGTLPKVANPPTATPVEIVTVSGQHYLQITIPRLSAHPATLNVEVSSDLTNWDAGPAFTVEVSNTPAARVVRDLKPLDPGVTRRFMRLKAELPVP
ncbi:MAG: SdrD B-like domain-containing protein [Verrucomicrobiota bacterium]